MKKPTRKQIILILIGVLIITAIVYGFLPSPEPVQTAEVTTASLQVTVEEEGKTYVKQQYVISSPHTAYARSIHFEPGDSIEEGTALVELEPPRSAPLDSRTQAEATARVESAEASLDQAEIRLGQATTERNRLERLVNAGTATQQQFEQAQTEFEQALGNRNAARADLTAALASAGNADEESARQRVNRVLRAPTRGRVLAVHHKSEGHIPAGEPLLEIGNTDSLEVRVEVLSQDAVRITPGMRVVLEQWGGEDSLEATVTRVEQQGNEVISALGVEEQRVQVIAELTSQKEKWGALGSGYRVLARFIIWEEDNVLQVPTSALFREDENWAVFVVEDGMANRRSVSVGQQTGLSAQILEGLSEGDTVIIHPGDAIDDGKEVEAE